jgi:uroporphyrinogen-III synthase
MAPATAFGPSDLAGFTVGITADRRGEDQALMFRRLGAEVVHGPTLRTLPLADEEELRARSEALITRPPDYLVANTGLGIRTWLAAADEWGRREELDGALRRARIAARGPKAAGAVARAGLEIWWRSASEQLADVSRHLVATGVAGRRIAFQLDGDEHREFVAALQDAGAEIIELPVYRWSLPGDAGAALRLVELCCSGGIDAVTFTAGPAVRNLIELADAAGRRTELLDALNGRVLAACIGPVCAGVAVEEGIGQPLVPDNWRLGSLVKLVAETLLVTRRR